MEGQLNLPGFSSTPQEQWPAAPEPDQKIQVTLDKNSETHARVLAYLKDRLEFSERKMAEFYSRWRVGEAKVQAYLDLPDYDKYLQDMNKSKAPPQVVNISIPHSFATVSTIVTYLLHTFCGRKPILQVGSHRADFIEKSRNMESVLQYNADHVRLIKQFAKFLHSTQIYGVGIYRIGWQNTYQMRTERTKTSRFTLMGIAFGDRLVSTRNRKLTYSGNEVMTLDPFLFFPDPRVPMVDVSRQGEFVFWRSFVGKHTLKQKELDGLYFQIDKASTQLPKAASGSAGGESQRGLLSQGDSMAGFGRSSHQGKMMPFYQEDQGTCIIIPRELGLGESEKPEKWLFTIINKDTIVQAEPFDADHGRHPVAVAEPYTLGQSFGSPSMMDFLGPLQDTISWLVNSHMFNIRSALNNMFVVDPSMIEMQDLKNPSPGKLIRLKRAAYGQDVRTIVNQLNVADVTRGHLTDLELFMRISQQLSGASDNIMGMHDSGGRKTATEVRTSGEAAASRLAAQARLISAQAVVDMAEMMAMNIQQYVDDQFYIEVLGERGAQNPVKITPDQLSGDFYFPIHDGTLPLDRVAMVDVWKEIFLGVSKDPTLRQNFNLIKIFENVAEMAGAKNIEQFKLNPANQQQLQVNPMETGQVEEQVQKGTLIPFDKLRAAAQGSQPTL